MKKTSIFLIAILIGIITSCKHKADDKELDINIIPEPVKIEKRKGFFEINPKTKVINPKHSKIQGVADYLIDQLAISTGYELEFGEPFEKENVIAFEFAAEEDLGIEGYHMDVTKEKVTIFTNTPEGAFYVFKLYFNCCHLK
ncbi:MAG: glycoside hydrolase family 20 zincin-like fold domain-containing protein [Bacteroidales bacterium]